MKSARQIVLGITLAVVTVVLSSCGPHMDRQQSLRPFERQMPQMPEGTIPTSGSAAAPDAETAVTLTNPLEPTAENLADGKRYYGYYCAMCHGTSGHGDGEVGDAYVPRPADLTSSSVTSLSDGELYRRMLTGTGHDPVMTSTVDEDRRWPLVLYVQRLGK